jgi:hypothetical protein
MRLPRNQVPKIDRRPVFFGVIGIMAFCYLTQFGFTLSPGARMGQGMFDHERPQSVQDGMDKQRKEKLGIELYKEKDNK